MKYKNASDVLPEDLFQEVQKYAAGDTLYFPKAQERKQWGETTGVRKYYQERNEAIRQKYLNKMSIQHLADEYCLSVETIRKIVFKDLTQSVRSPPLLKWGMNWRILRFQ